MPQYGFIYAVRDDFDDLRDIVSKANSTNIMLKGFVPQKELLNDDRVLALIGHGGVNSIMECIYYGKTVLGFTIDDDQVGSSYRIEMMEIGISLRRSPTVHFVTDSINRILANPATNSYQQNIDR